MIRTDETSKEFIENVVKKVEVLRLPEFKHKFNSPSDLPEIGKVTNDSLDIIDVYFFR